MLTLLAANWLPLLLALLIGFATGWWAWARPDADAGAEMPLPDHWEEDLAVPPPYEQESLPLFPEEQDGRQR